MPSPVSRRLWRPLTLVCTACGDNMVQCTTWHTMLLEVRVSRPRFGLISSYYRNCCGRTRCNLSCLSRCCLRCCCRRLPTLLLLQNVARALQRCGRPLQPWCACTGLHACLAGGLNSLFARQLLRGCNDICWFRRVRFRGNAILPHVAVPLGSRRFLGTASLAAAQK